VVCLAAGVQQLPVVRAARALGLSVVGVDRDPQAPAFAACDARVLASTHDPATVLRGLQPLTDRFRFEGVLVRSAGPPVVTAAEVCAALGLPGVPPASARTIVDKERLVRACQEADLPAPALRSGARLAEIAPDSLPLPCVVKPALGLVGKHAIRLVADRAQLASAFEAARAASLTGRVSVEGYVPGLDVGLVSVVREGALHPITLIDEWNELDASGHVRPRGVAAPSRFSGRPEEARVLALARGLIAHFGLRTTAFMMACRITPAGQPVLTEIHLDLGGDRILDDLLPASATFDVLTHAIALLTERSASMVPPGAFQPAGILFDGDDDAGDPSPARRRSARVLIADDRPALDLAMGRI
jgi:hypothetical protein